MYFFCFIFSTVVFPKYSLAELERTAGATRLSPCPPEAARCWWPRVGVDDVLIPGMYPFFCSWLPFCGSQHVYLVASFALYTFYSSTFLFRSETLCTTVPLFDCVGSVPFAMYLFWREKLVLCTMAPFDRVGYWYLFCSFFSEDNFFLFHDAGWPRRFCTLLSTFFSEINKKMFALLYHRLTA